MVGVAFFTSKIRGIFDVRGQSLTLHSVESQEAAGGCDGRLGPEVIGLEIPSTALDEEPARFSNGKPRSYPEAIEATDARH